MRILIDGHMLGLNETGNETYIEGLVGGFDLLGSEDVAVAISENLKGFDSISKYRLNSSGNIARLLHHLPRLCRDWEADILQTTYISPLYVPCKSVVTVHDVSFRKFPEFFSPRDRLLLNTMIPISMRRADAVITISDYSKKEILRYYPSMQGKVHSILLAPKFNYRANEDLGNTEQVLRKFKISTKYILFVGNLQPRKNLRRLIKAYARIHKDIHPVKLVIVGASKWRSTDVFDLVQSLELEDKLNFTGYVTEGELKTLYSLAEVFIFPSVYEGFGLPILEAMVCQTPVICSRAASMPEVAGESVLYIDPYQVDDIAGAMLMILENKQLAEELQKKASDWVKEFSWEIVARKTLKVYQDLLK